MKYLKHISIRILFGLFFLSGLNQTVSALLPGYLSGKATIGENPTLVSSDLIIENPTLVSGDLIIGSGGELYLGTHLPYLQQKNTLFLHGNYFGEPGARSYHSVLDNSNNFGTRGFIGIMGTANGTTEIMLDMFTGWDGSCIDLARAYDAGSNTGAFTMSEGSYNGHQAYLKSRVDGSDRTWFLAERMILNAYLFPEGQGRCLGGLDPFAPLTVETPTTGSYLYQWYRKSGVPSDSRDFSNAIPVGSANGGQTASYTPVITADTTFYYFCVVRNANCSAYNIDTTDVSGAFKMSGEPKVHIYGANLCIGKDTLFIAEVYEGDPNGTGHWHISEGLAASIDEVTGKVTANSQGKFTVTYHYTTPDGCSTIVVSQEYEVFMKPVAEVQDVLLCSPQIIPASSLLTNLVNADIYKIYESDGVTEITGQNIQVNYGAPVTYLVEAINTNCHCVAERVAVRVSVTDNITFDLPAMATVCSGSASTIDLADLVKNVNVSDYTIEVYANNELLSGTLVTASNQPYYVKVVSHSCSSEGKGIIIVESAGNVRIVTQPGVQSYDLNELYDYVNFFVVAEGDGLTYKWYQIENGVTTEMDGETDAILSIQVIDINPNVSYYVSVIGGCGDNYGKVIVNSDIVYADACRPLILQKKNHTLAVNNNINTNGGYSFVYFEWYKNNESIHKGGYGEGLGGIYNTGGSNLNPADVYYVIVTDQNGRKHRTCAYNPVTFVYGTRITAYPNPTSTVSSLVVVDVETDDEELLENGVITSYNTAGQYLGQVRTEGHRITPVQLPSVAGVYILKFVSGDVEKEIKIIVQ